MTLLGQAIIRRAAVLLTASVLAGVPTPCASDPEAALQPADLAGRWRLDWERSPSMEPFLEAIEVPWPIRQLAGRASVELRIVARDGALVQVVQHAIGREERTLWLDGVVRRERGVLGSVCNGWIGYGQPRSDRDRELVGSGRLERPFPAPPSCGSNCRG